MHDTLTIGVPTFVIVPGILFNRTAMRDLRAEMNRRFDEVHKRFDDVTKRLDRVDGDLKVFDRITAKLDSRVDKLSRC